jgi:hypothetical protein
MDNYQLLIMWRSQFELGASHVGMSIYTHEALWAEKGKDR